MKDEIPMEDLAMRIGISPSMYSTQEGQSSPPKIHFFLALQLLFVQGVRCIKMARIQQMRPPTFILISCEVFEKSGILLKIGKNHSKKVFSNFIELPRLNSWGEGGTKCPNSI